MAELSPLRFGVFPLGVAGTPDGLASGAADDPELIAAALARLQGQGRPWLIRAYVVWTGRGSTRSCLDALRLWAAQPWDLDMVLCYRDPAGDVEGWLALVREAVATWGDRFSTVQVTSEANLASAPGAADGAFPRVAEALVGGVMAAAAAKRDCGATVEVGFAVAFAHRLEQSLLWPEVRRLGGAEFAAALDYVGIDMYPDVFGPPLALERLGGAASMVLRFFREQVLEPVGIGPSVAVHVCENGWPTGSRRSPQHQADALEALVRAVHAVRQELNVTHWELFTLRDADSTVDSLFYQFGILRDDYTPKPAFDRLAQLYHELG